MTFDPSTLKEADLRWWNAWKVRAENERATCLAAYAANNLYEFVDAIWREFKEFALKCVFHNKCGYCESPVAAVTYGDADHFRPKKKVTMKVGGKTQEVTCEGGEPHPGYYWLAYDWRNLIPACEKCNRAAGKMNQFPVRRAHHCRPGLDGDDLDNVEEPLLLNPHRDSSVGALRFGDRGTVAIVDENERGVHSVRVYRLDREELETERFRAQKAAWHEWLLALGYDPAQAPKVLSKWESGFEPYSVAALDYITLMWHEVEPRIGET